MLKAPLYRQGAPSSRSTLGFPLCATRIESLAAVLLSLSEKPVFQQKLRTPHL